MFDTGNRRKTLRRYTLIIMAKTKKTDKKSVGKNMAQPELLCIIKGYDNWYSHFDKRSFSFL